MDGTKTEQATLALVENARRGDREAYDRLFERVADQAMLFLKLRIGPHLRERLDPLDILQDGYLEAFRAFDRFAYRGPGSFTRWLCQILENCVRAQADHFGAKKGRPPGAQVPVSEVIERVRKSTNGPLREAARAEAERELARALDALDEHVRLDVAMRFFEGLTLDEIATRTGRSEATVRRSLGSALAQLGTLLAQLETRE